MAFVVDKARQVLVNDIGMATNAFVQPTPRVYPRGFPIKASVVDPKITGTTPPTGMATQAAYPVVDMSAFWLAKVVKTERFT